VFQEESAVVGETVLYVDLHRYNQTQSVPVAARSKACGRSLAGIASSNPARVMDVCLL